MLSELQILAVLVVHSVLLGTASTQGQDLTVQAGANGSSVVTACISRIHESRIFSDDNELLRRIAYVETRDGNDVGTYGEEYDGGIWAMSQNLFESTQDTASYSVLTNLHLQIQTSFSIQWSSVQWSDLRKPLYSALAARLYFYTVSASIPISSNIQSQATYWATYYNTLGSTSEFVTLVNELEAQNDCSVSGIDIYFVLDESGSVGDENYQLMKQFVYDTVNEFDIGPDDTQVGVISFSDFATARFYLNTYHDKATLLTAISNLPYDDGGTNTAAALDLLRQQGYTQANGGRPQSQAVPRIAVVITDGRSNVYSSTVSAATSVHNEHIIVFSVGVGGNVNNAELDAIASDPSYVSTLTGFDTSQFDALQTTLTNEACTTAAGVEVNETISNTIEEGEVTYIELPFSDDGVTITVTVSNGSVVVYASDQITTPNEAFYDWMIETDGYSDVYLDPNDVNRTVGDTVYVAIEGEKESNNYTLSTTTGDTSTQRIAAPDAPTNVLVGFITATSVSIIWTAPRVSNHSILNIIIRYEVELIDYQFSVSTIRVNTTNTSISIDGLEEYNTYQCKAAAVNGVGIGAYSSAVNFTTTEAAPDGSPTNVSIEVMSSTSLSIKWQPPEPLLRNGAITKYTLFVHFVKNESVQILSVPPDTLSMDIEGIQKNSNVSVKIAAQTSVGIGPFSEEVSAVTYEDLPGRPEELKLEIVNDTAVSLSWAHPDSPNGVILEYEVIYYGYKPAKKEKDDNDSLEILDGPKTISLEVDKESSSYSLIVLGLIPGYQYNFKVRGRTKVGYGDNSTVATIVLTSTTSQMDSGLSAGVIVVVIVGATAAAILVIVLLACFLFHRRTHKAKFDVTNTVGYDHKMETLEQDLTRKHN